VDKSTRDRPGFTVMELLVAMFIIGVMMSILLAAVQMVRESGRRTSCVNNLHQIGTAVQQHLANVGYYPSSGTGGGLSGDATLGFDLFPPAPAPAPVLAPQTGGWIYNILPFLDQQSLHDISLNSSNKFNAIGMMNATPLAVFYCPSRRAATAYPLNAQIANAQRPSNGKVAKTDYAANGGTEVQPIIATHNSSSAMGPTTDAVLFRVDGAGRPSYFTGVSGERSHVQDIPDGISYTYFACEKYLNPSRYISGDDGGDSKAMYVGNSFDTNRVAGPLSNPRAYPPACDKAKMDPNGSYRFGSAHSDGFNALMCDNSVHFVRYSILPEIHSAFAHRDDRGLHPPEALQ
jgi:prepilin-type N-terminal cleavage/methylation domain-containing protein